MGCPYSDKELDYWEGVCNPMGKACHTCEWYECEHNPNFDPREPWFDPYELEKDMGND